MRPITPPHHDQSSFREVWSHRLREWLVTGALVAGGSFVAVPVAHAVVAGDVISGPAELQAGLRGAERLAAPPPRSTTPRLEADVQAVLDLVNVERRSRGLGAMSHHVQLSQAAHAHAADQFDRDCLTQLSHVGTDGSNPGDRIARTGLGVRNWAENIACGYLTPLAVMDGWMNSAGHRQNILNAGLTHIGISVTRDSDGRMYWVQVFGTPR